MRVASGGFEWMSLPGIVIIMTVTVTVTVTVAVAAMRQTTVISMEALVVTAMMRKVGLEDLVLK